MARVQVTERSRKSQIDLDRIPITGEIISLGDHDYVQVTAVCLYPPSAPVDAIVLAVKARENLSADMKGAIKALES